MRSMLVFAAAGAMFLSVPAVSQMMTAADVGATPLAGTSATDYVKLAADSDRFEIESGRLAATKSKRADVKDFAKQMVSAHTDSSKTLMAALSNPDRKITPPSMSLSDANAAKLALLRKAPRKSFDDLYLQQQVDAHKAAWALQAGYAADGTDASLKQVATTVVPVVESHIAMLKTLTPPM